MALTRSFAVKEEGLGQYSGQVCCSASVCDVSPVLL